MKSWFVFDVDGERVGVWANNTMDAETMISRHYEGATFLGIDYGRYGTKAERCLYDGISPIEMVVATGVLNLV